MMALLLVAGIGFLLAGLVAIGFGIPVKEFSFGNTLILAGAVGACTGAVMLSLAMVVRELKHIAQRLGAVSPDASHVEMTPEPAAASAVSRSQAPESGGFLFSRDQPTAENTGHAEPAVTSSAPSPAPWREELRGRLRNEAPPAPEPVEAAPAAKQRRNLLFSSSLRKERERAQARTADPSMPDLGSAPPPVDPGEVPPPAFDDAWPRLERAKAADALPRRAGRPPSTFTDASLEAGADGDSPPVHNEDPPPVTVLKSGVVDGMAYSLYSDGSIEAQMPEGMMRFASIDELRAHLDQRP
jgi:hypothetical protein